MDLINIIGTVAGICTTSSFLPQVVKTVKTKSTSDLSLSMYAVMCVGIALWLVYGILMNAWPIIIANGISIVLGLVILVYKVRYR